MLGNGRIEAKCQDGETRLAQIRGKMRKKVNSCHCILSTILAFRENRFTGLTYLQVWIMAGDIILLSLREFEDGKADVIVRYTPDEARNLKTYGELKSDFQIHENQPGEGEGGSDDDEAGIEFEEAEIDDI